MSFNLKSYPDEMNDLAPDVRNRAIKLANEFMRDGMDKKQAIALAIDRAKKLQPK